MSDEQSVDTRKPDGKFKKASSFLFAKRNRGLLGALIVLVVLILAGIAWGLVSLFGGGDGDPEPAPTQASEGPVVVEVPGNGDKAPGEGEEPTDDSSSTPSENASDAQDATPAPEDEQEPTEAPGVPRGTGESDAVSDDLPGDLPLPEGAELTTVQELSTTRMVNMTIPDSIDAIYFYDDIIGVGNDYYLMSRSVTPAGTAARIGLGKTGEQVDITIRISDDNTMSITVPR